VARAGGGGHPGDRQRSDPPPRPASNRPCPHSGRAPDGHFRGPGYPWSVLWLTGDPEADALLSSEPLALLIGMVLDQQIPMERAFKAPFDLKERLGGSLDPAAIAAMPPDDLAAVFAAKPALHRFPRSMAGRVQEVCGAVLDSYGGDTAAIWTSADDGKQLLANVKALPGFGDQKARIFVALLGKQFGVQPPGWDVAAGAYGEPGSSRSVADIDSPEALARVRQFKQAAKAEARAKLPNPG